MDEVSETTPRRTIRRLIAVAAIAGAAAAASVATAAASSGFSPSTSAAPPTTALGGGQATVIAILRPATLAVLADESGSLMQGPVLAMPAITGDDWNASAPRRVVFDLTGDATVDQVRQLVHAVEQDRAVESVSVSIPG